MKKTNKKIKKIPEKSGENQEIRNEKGQFIPGVSGNPNGKPKGLKSFDTDFEEAVQEIADMNKITFSEARKILIKKAFSEAKNGNYPFYRDLLDRYYGKAIERVEHSGKIISEFNNVPEVVEAVKKYEEFRDKQIKDEAKKMK